jgi:3-oxoacyl-[acyl-carrier-protein] synthase II
MKANITGIGWVTSKNSGSLKDLSTFEMTPEPLPEIPITDLGPAARRMDAYSRLGMSGILHALRDAGLVEWTVQRNIGVAAATEYACLTTDIAFYDSVASADAAASPALFSYTLPNTFLGEAAIHFGLTGPTYVINGGRFLDVGILEMALDGIFSGETDTMLCGVVNPPAPRELPDTPPPLLGTLFFVVERRPGDRLSYGAIGFNEEGRIEFDGSEIGDLAEIVRRCLKR